MHASLGGFVKCQLVSSVCQSFWTAMSDLWANESVLSIYFNESVNVIHKTASSLLVLWFLLLSSLKWTKNHSLNCFWTPLFVERACNLSTKKLFDSFICFKCFILTFNILNPYSLFLFCFFFFVAGTELAIHTHVF